jgi:predicted ATPase
MTDRLQLLSRGMRNAPARQQTMAATIAWSYDLLHVTAQALFRHLAVFEAGFTLGGAQAVAASLGDLWRDVTTTLEMLVAQNLVRRLDGAGEPRFAMLETIREFGLARLDEAGEREATTPTTATNRPRYPWKYSITASGRSGLTSARH